MCSIYLAHFKNSPRAVASGRMRRGIKRQGGSGGRRAWQVPGDEARKGAAVVRGSERRTNLPPGHAFEGGLFMSFSSACFCSSLLSLLP